MRVINDGDTGGTLCAAFYVFDDSQEMQECCSCPVTADGLIAESVNRDLLGNSLTSFVNHRGVIAEEGHHSDLMAKGGVYRKLYEAQFKLTEEELEKDGALES